MIDVTLPLELDDGTPCELVRSTQTNVIVCHAIAPTRPEKVTHAREWTRPNTHGWYYRIVDGVFSGGDPKNQFVLRNVVDKGPEPYEAWFK